MFFSTPSPIPFLQLTHSVFSVGITFFVVQSIDSHIVQQGKKKKKPIQEIKKEPEP